MDDNNVFNHTIRNIYLYVMLYFILNVLFTYSIPAKQLFLGILIFVVAYLPVYFLNDYTDRQDDDKVFNLYNFFHNYIFWSSAMLISATGVIATVVFSPKAIFFLFGLYILNYMYSWLRYKNEVFFRETIIFLVYFVKMFAMAAYMDFPLKQSPVPVFLMVGAGAAISIALYKRHIKRYWKAEMFFIGVYTVSFLVSVWFYRSLFWAFGPLIPLFFWLMYKYKKHKIPIGKYQTYYFAFVIIVLANI